MLNSLSGVLQYVAQTGQRREVTGYLQDTTQESVLRDLLKAFRRRKTEIRSLERIFNTHAHKDISTQELFWSEQSLQDHISTTNPLLTSSKGAMRLLWRSFHFYAYHPFPRNTAKGRIDWEAFQRAATMLAAQGADLLGILEEIESYWRFDGDNLYHQAKLKRIFRSIGTPELSIELCDESSHIVEETADVLAMTQPFFMHNGPHEHQLTPTARRLLGENLIRTRYRVSRKDLATLLSILNRLQLSKDSWGLSFPFGSFEQAELGDDELANILLNGLEGDQRQEDLEFEHVNHIMHLLPNLNIRFYQMWAVLFQPSMAVDSEARPPDPSRIPSSILGSISLFIPHPVVSTLTESRRDDRRIALEDPISLSDEEEGTMAMRVTEALAEDARPHVLLVTGIDTATSRPTVFGAYFPSESTGNVQLLFQLRPRFHLHNISIAGDSLSPDPAAGLHVSVDNSIAFCIGQPAGEGNCIIIDPSKRLATMTLPRHAENFGFSKHHESGLNDMRRSENVEVVFSDVTIQKVSGSAPTVLPGPSKPSYTKGLPAITQERAEIRVQGEELRSRIVGFGSSG